MNNPFYRALSGANGMNGMLAKIKSNPGQFLAQYGVNIPQGMTDPNAILQHLLSSGRVSQNQINAAYQQSRQLRGM